MVAEHDTRASINLEAKLGQTETYFFYYFFRSGRIFCQILALVCVYWVEYPFLGVLK